MPPKTDTTPVMLRPFVAHGMDVSKIGTDECEGSCVFCGSTKFYVGLTKSADGKRFPGGWFCQKCTRHGNIATWLSQVWECCVAATGEDQYAVLASERGVSVESLRLYGLARSFTGEWIVPGYCVKGSIGNLYRYKPIGGGKRTLMPTPGGELHAGYYRPTPLPDSYDVVEWIEGCWNACARHDSLEKTDPTRLSRTLVVGTPGANTWDDGWAALSAGKYTAVMMDNDHPKTNTKTGTVVQSGWAGTKRVVTTLLTLQPPALSIGCLTWGENGYDPELPDKYDIRDVCTQHNGTAVSFVDARLAPPPESWLTTGRSGHGPTTNPNLPQGQSFSNSSVGVEKCESWEELKEAWKPAIHYTPEMEAVLTFALCVGAAVTYGENRLWGRVIGPPSCLSGDTLIPINRAKNGRSMRLRELVKRFNGIPRERGGPPWDHSLPTMVSRAEDGYVRLCRLMSAWESGVKETYTLQTEKGRSIRASADHPFMMEDGSFCRLGDIRVGDGVSVDIGQSNEGCAKKKQYRMRYTKYHPRQNKTKDGYRTFEHHLVVEAEMNALPFDDFLKVLRTDRERAAGFVYLPRGVLVHHKDRNYLNNVFSNLQVLSSRAEHAKEHADENVVNVLSRVGTDRVTGVTKYGEEPTYDMEVEGDPHCFVANQFVVHNSGKSMICAGISASTRHCVTESVLPATGFYSGTITKDNEDHSFANRLWDRCWVNNDADTLRTQVSREVIFAQMRDLYGGKGSKVFHNGVGSRSYEGLRFGVLFAGTEAIYDIDASELGARFLDLCVSPPDREARMKMAMVAMKRQSGGGADQNGMSPTLRLATQKTGGYLEHLREKYDRRDPGIRLSDEVMKKLYVLSEYVCHLQSRPSDIQDEHQGSVALPIRVSTQLTALLVYASLVRGKSAIDLGSFNLVRRVALNTAEGRTSRIIRAVASVGDEGVDLSGILSQTRRDQEREWVLVNHLVEIAVLEETDRGIPSVSKRVYYRLTGEFRQLYDAVFGITTTRNE